MVEREGAYFLEVREVLRVGPRPAAFDVVDAEGVERLRERELVGQTQVDALTLGAVPQSGVVNLDVRGHGRCRRSSLTARSGQRRGREFPLDSARVSTTYRDTWRCKNGITMR